MKHQYLPIILLTPTLWMSFYYGYTPLLVAAIFGIISIVAFAVYYKDKSAAVRGAWRTPESTLHLLSLMCGWPGAIIAQQAFRHKTQKKSFRFVFWITVIINLTVFSWLHTQEGAKLLRVNIYKIDKYLVNNYGSDKTIKYLRYLTQYNIIYL